MDVVTANGNVFVKRERMMTLKLGTESMEQV